MGILLAGPGTAMNDPSSSGFFRNTRLLSNNFVHSFRGSPVRLAKTRSARYNPVCSRRERFLLPRNFVREYNRGGRFSSVGGVLFRRLDDCFGLDWGEDNLESNLHLLLLLLLKVESGTKANDDIRFESEVRKHSRAIATDDDMLLSHNQQKNLNKDEGDDENKDDR